MRLCSLIIAVFAFSTLASYSSSPDSSSESGVEGVITMSPTRPGPLRRDDPVSKPLAGVGFVIEENDRRVATFTTDDQGRFKVLLKPGRYTVSRDGQKLPAGYFGPFDLEIQKGQLTKVEWNCDSGMR